MSAPVHGLVDFDGCLIAADPPLAALHRRAGGREGGALAVPQLASLARLVRRLGIAVSRGVVAADGDADFDLWVRAAPDEGGVRLAIVDWTERAPVPAPSPARDFARAEGDWTWAADTALRLTALSPLAPGQSLIGEPLARLVTFRPASDGGLPILDALADRRGFDVQDGDLRHGSGGLVRLSGAPRFDASGRFVGFEGIARAGPERAAATSGTAFEQRLGDALKAPLDRIIAAADTIRARGEGPLRRDYTRYAEDIASAGRHLMALIGDLVDLSAIERPDYRPERETIDLADLARRAAGLLALRAFDGQVTLATPGPDEVLPATGEFRRVLQILVNLIGNAIRYAPPASTVSVRGEVDGAVVRLTVADEGRGIAGADQARIFDKFERADPAEPGGTGLGLYIARRLARAMGGDLTVESAPGAGARFALTLPAG